MEAIFSRIRSLLSRSERKVVRGDNWQNPYTGYGTSRDKLTHGFHTYSTRLSDVELSSLFYSDDIAAKLVEKRPEECFRRGYKLCLGSDEGKAKELVKQANALKLNAKLQEAFKWGRLFGGSLLVIGADQGNPATPLKKEAIRDVKFLNVVDRRYATVKSWYMNPLDPKYGHPEVYSISGQFAPSVDIHESRCVRFDGTEVDAQKRVELGGWSYSVLQRPYEVMRTFATAFQSSGVLVADASQAVFKMKGLFDMIASGEKERLQTRMQMVDMSRSAARSVLLDSDGEDFERIATEFTGLPEMLDRMMMRLASSIDMPVTILMGRSPAGQNATGASDFQHWYDSIQTQQVNEVEPKLLEVYDILAKGTLEDAEPTVEWKPLAALTDEEKAAIDKTKAETHKIYVDMGALFAEEVALAEFGTEQNGEIVIDEDVRHKSLELEKELALNPPPVAAVDPVTGEPINAPPGQQSTPPSLSQEA